MVINKNNNVMVINKKEGKIKKLCVLLKFVSLTSIISSIMFAKYFPFWQLYVEGFQT